MKTDELIKHIQQLDKNYIYSRKRVDELELQVERLKLFPNHDNLIPINYGFYELKNTITNDEVILAFQRTVDYEGLKDYPSTILNTFMLMLNNTHHSLNSK